MRGIWATGGGSGADGALFGTAFTSDTFIHRGQAYDGLVVEIRPAMASDVENLAAIESAGDALFAAAGHPEFVGQGTISPDDARMALAAGDLWVAVVDEDVVGFVQMSACGAERAVHQISVHPDSGGRGIGTALMHHVIERERSAGESTVVLDTQADVPWNQPWYEQLGFIVVPPDVWTEAMRETVAEQTAVGLDWSTRVHMRLRLD